MENLLIGIDRPPPKFDGGDVVKVVRKGGQKKVVRKGGQKTAERLLEIVKLNPAVTQAEMMQHLGIKSRNAIQKHIAYVGHAAYLWKQFGPPTGFCTKCLIYWGKHRISGGNIHWCEYAPLHWSVSGD